jgi:small subunit ribosomal protein S17
MAKSFIGTVSSDKADKTIVVTIRTRKTHPLYRKQYTVSKRFSAHDEKNEARTGDRVEIVETRPISANKRFRLERIIEKPALREDALIATKVDEPQPKTKAKSEPEAEEKSS